MSEENSSDNTKSQWLHLLGVIIIIAGVLGGIAMFGQASDYLTNEAMKTMYRIRGVIIIASGIISGSLFIGLSEIISLLSSLVNQSQTKVEDTA